MEAAEIRNDKDIRGRYVVDMQDNKYGGGRDAG